LFLKLTYSFPQDDRDDDDSSNFYSNSLKEENGATSVDASFKAYTDPKLLQEILRFVGDLNRTIKIELNEIKNDLNEMKSEIAEVKSEITEVKSEFKDLRNDFDKKFEAIKSLINSAEARTNGSIALSSALETAVRIEIFPGSDDRNNTFASGNYVSINGTCYVSTCKHVVLRWIKKTNKTKVREIISIEMIDGSRLTPDESVLISTKSDLALIEVDCEKGHRPAEIASMEPHLGNPLYGISHRPKGTVYVHCRILEIHPDHEWSKRFETDCSSTHGFSGTGLFDQFGYLTIVISANRPFQHLYDESLNEIYDNEEWLANVMMESSTEFDWKRGKEKCVKVWSMKRSELNTTHLGDCFDLIRLNTQNAALNPRSQGEPAVDLLELPTKGQKRTIPFMYSDD
jgi:hypothetical protein